MASTDRRIVRALNLALLGCSVGLALAADFPPLWTVVGWWLKTTVEEW